MLSNNYRSLVANAASSICSMDAWLDGARARIAADTGLDPEQLSLAREDVDALLDLARVAAHDSGQRTNAPLVCYMLGRAMAEGGDLAALARSAAGSDDAR